MISLVYSHGLRHPKIIEIFGRPKMFLDIQIEFWSFSKFLDVQKSKPKMKYQKTWSLCWCGYFVWMLFGCFWFFGQVKLFWTSKTFSEFLDVQKKKFWINHGFEIFGRPNPWLYSTKKVRSKVWGKVRKHARAQVKEVRGRHKGKNHK